MSGFGRSGVVLLSLYVLCAAALLLVPDEHLRLVRAILVGVTFLVILGFCVAYHITTKGHWRDIVHGWHIMLFSASFALIMGFLVLAMFGLIPPWLQPLIGGWIYLTVLFLFLWRWAILRAGNRALKARES